MANGIYIAVSGATSRTQELDVLANNLANARTTGFKRAQVSFHSIQASAEGAQGGPETRSRNYVQTHESRPCLEQGDLIRTDNALDVAIQGKGFFKVSSDKGDRLTRDGRFMISGPGLLKTINGEAVLDDQGSTIFLSAEEVPRIDSDGRIFSENVEVGRLQLVAVPPGEALKRDGSHLFEVPESATSLSGESNVLIEQGWLEGSNARPTKLMIDLVQVQRAYNAMTKAISTYQDFDRAALRIVR